MSLPLVLLGLALLGQSPPKLQKPAAAGPAAQPTEGEQTPPEEDESLKPKDYQFNPMQAKKEMSIGDYYFKVKKNYKGAAARYQEATRWNSQMAEAFLKLGEAEEKLDEPKLARDAYQQFLELSPNAKESAEVKKRLQKLPAS